MYQFHGWHFPDLDRHFIRAVGEYPDTNYQQATIDEALQHVKKFDCAIDVGGNIGLHTVRFAARFKQVHSFEPADVNYECLKENTKLFSNVQLHQVGLGDVENTLTIKLPADSDNCGNFSVVDFADSNTALEQTISIKKLDSFDLAPGLIKIDVQGFDYNVLVGARATITKHRPVVIVEIESKKSKSEIAEFLTACGLVHVAKVRHDQIWAPPN